MRVSGDPVQGLRGKLEIRSEEQLLQEACGPASQSRDLLAALEVFPGVCSHLLFYAGMMLDAVLSGMENY